MEKDKYSSQKKHLSEHKKQLRVWIDPQKYAEFQAAVEKNGTSIYAVINDYIEKYIIDTNLKELS